MRGSMDNTFRNFLKTYFIEVQVIYNVVLISAVQQSESYMCIYIHIHILFHILFHYDLLQDIEELIHWKRS